MHAMRFAATTEAQGPTIPAVRTPAPARAPVPVPAAPRAAPPAANPAGAQTVNKVLYPK